MRMILSEPEQITEPVAYHGEGPCWHESWGGWRWVDMLAGDLLTVRKNGDIERLNVGKIAAFVRPRARGRGYVVGRENDVALADQPFAKPVTFTEVFPNADGRRRLNEGGCDPAGNLWVGTMFYEKKVGGAALYRVTPTGDVTLETGGVTTSNGMDFSPDGQRAYYNDTETETTDMFDWSRGRLYNRRPFAKTEIGRVDGLCVDSAGNVWVALNRAGIVRCYSPLGEILDQVQLPVALTTACALGGPDGRDLIVTTSRENLENPEPTAGALYRVKVKIPGKPILPFAR